MTDEEFAAANAEYDALPGTPPDGWSFIPEADLGETGDEARAVMMERLDLWRDNGATWFRVTHWTGEYQPAGCEAGIWIEAWKEQPRKQADFNPPLVANTPADGEGS